MNKDWLEKVVKAAASLAEQRSVKAVKVSQKYYDIIKRYIPSDPQIKEHSYGYTEVYGVPIIIDDDVETWKVVYVGDEDE